MNKPDSASCYDPSWVTLARETCLYIATILGDYSDDIVVIGGLVPGLLINQDDLPPGTTRHAGTQDVDIALNLALLDNERYSEISDRLRKAGFTAARKSRGQVRFQTWQVAKSDGRVVTVDFLIAPCEPGAPGHIKHLEPDFGAVVTPGVQLAFIDRVKIRIRGTTIRNETAERDIYVCGQGAFIVLKALALSNRGLGKDAYDLHYVARNYSEGPRSAGASLHKLSSDPIVAMAVESIRQNFQDSTAFGPTRIAKFVGQDAADELRQDIVGDIRALLREFDKLAI